MQAQGFEKIKQLSNNLYELCLEETHINMAITKIGGMLRTSKVKNIIFATVDKSPHCVQMHYIRSELEKMMNLSNIKITNYVVNDNKLFEISLETISLSKNLMKLESGE